jgi:hypothetical protein
MIGVEQRLGEQCTSERRRVRDLSVVAGHHRYAPCCPWRKMYIAAFVSGDMPCPLGPVLTGSDHSELVSANLLTPQAIQRQLGITTTSIRGPCVVRPGGSVSDLWRRELAALRVNIA